MIKMHHTIREYGLIASDDSEREAGGILYIKKHDYNNLEDFVLRNSGDEASEGSGFFSLTHKKGVGRCLQAKNYVGVIQTDSGLVVEILPKIHREKSEGEESVPDTRRLFLRVLRTVKDSPFRQFNSQGDMYQLLSYAKIYEAEHHDIKILDRIIT